MTLSSQEIIDKLKKIEQTELELQKQWDELLPLIKSTNNIQAQSYGLKQNLRQKLGDMVWHEANNTIDKSDAI